MKKSWEVTFSEYKTTNGSRYKVTRRFPDYSIAETKVFNSKEAAKKQFEEWLHEN